MLSCRILLWCNTDLEILLFVLPANLFLPCNFVSVAPGVVPEPASEMAPPGEDGGGETGPERIPRRHLPVQSGGIQPGSPHGPVAVAAAPLRPARLPEPPADRLSQLPDPAGGGGPQQAAPRRALAPTGRRPRPQDHLHRGPQAQGQGARGEHHQGDADGVGRDDNPVV